MGYLIERIGFSIGLDKLIFILYSNGMKLNKPLQKAKVMIGSKELKTDEAAAFAASEFQQLKRRKLSIPVKLFHL
ncbi:hypothetical protein A3G67_01675 [Candidatus Roizmanbacteria bacterium RIFCSPLOWO2_12_FULL_40_12]|uniref:Uncharacterized protein n=1 Tax=Candidatus Roizmanbacteria bacterium RIFCSPLOWO2_01_FULL_40_42 TaxID=1802066 RepID=A0A1F7J3W5_9BACT|nr:MAG: hypothetical protein A2779_03995 [Candidatus Roizmanbacteria bacterium RIFCSPHIGHO2_01_FULL_40_98]OGK28750.1 MAG: hypothetical protein A3C31_02325 [Candidatus Roizmanbacteria bacterium RIFCSPHIGHO2_02_FULL_40_53]OGK30205.1 MAG: hypothetical protein A2W49_01280 [Candidatus Roizmanbacteria bacterium RIFCSPHIGHO2_12_41_18]OGK36659.1 MAG: hypothetical protein A3E69_01745 [Candidatus Roizmanbacteria bacterium RIFCSPHIGHO2_12_FULL_40_130]OGK50300.1 MAG: hypothetical protein A3B50_02930 [Candi